MLTQLDVNVKQWHLRLSLPDMDIHLPLAAATSDAASQMRDGPAANGEQELFGIAELAKEFDVTSRTLRFYEDRGLIAPVRVNGNRVYSRRDRARLALILRARAIGSSLSEIAEYLDLYGEKGEGREQQLAYVVEKTREAMADLEQRKALIELSLVDLSVIHEESKRKLAAKRSD